MTAKSYSPWSTRLVATSLCVLFAASAFWACNEDPTPSLYQPETFNTLAAPVIASIDPAGEAFAGLGTITISGQNFSAVKTDNTVYFDDIKGEILEASPIQLKVKVPNLVSDNVSLKITVAKVEKFSNVISYKLVAAVAPLFKFAEIDEPWAIAADAQDNILASLTSNSLGDGVKKITAAGTKSDFAPRLTGTVTRFNGLKVGPGGALYGVTFERRILQMPAAGGAATNWVVLPNTQVRLNDLDFDREGNLWTAGSLDLHRVKQDKNARSFPFTGTIRAVRVYNGAVYLGGVRNNQETVWRVPSISADQVGPEEEYFNFSSKYAGAIYALTFSADGDMLIGTDAPEAIVVVHADKSAEQLYSGLFPSKCFSFAWGTGNFLYATQEKKTVVEGTTTRLVEPQTILTINMLKKGAPYYGRGDN